eukprot:m.593739 g.593739  ORF g.593739 m.593739 type:complete len:128 (+) comp58027_c0_seq22:129-512(+)
MIRHPKFCLNTTNGAEIQRDSLLGPILAASVLPRDERFHSDHFFINTTTETAKSTIRSILAYIRGNLHLVFKSFLRFVCGFCWICLWWCDWCEQGCRAAECCCAHDCLLPLCKQTAASIACKPRAAL